MTHEQALQWIENHCSLHRHFEVLYVVAGYRVSITDDSGASIQAAYGETLLKAIEELSKHYEP